MADYSEKHEVDWHLRFTDNIFFCLLQKRFPMYVRIYVIGNLEYNKFQSCFK